MKRLIILGLSLALLLLTAGLAVAQRGGCFIDYEGGSHASQSTLTIPIAKLEFAVLGIEIGELVELSVEIILDEEHSLELQQTCYCDPACSLEGVISTSVRYEGTTKAFGGKLEWADTLQTCLPGTGKSSTQHVVIDQSITRDTGRWFGGFSLSLLGITPEQEEVSITLGISTTCDCYDDCPGTNAPSICSPHSHLDFVVGETKRVTVTASDFDGDLKDKGIDFLDTGTPFACRPEEGGSAGNATSVTFLVTCLEPEWQGPESFIEFIATDVSSHHDTLYIPVTIWRGQPTIEIVEEECRWDRGEYMVAFRVHDPDLDPDACQQQAEILTCEIIDVVGGTAREGSPYSLEYVCGSGATDSGVTHTVGFTPSPESDSQSFTFRVTDKAGHEVSVTVPVNHPPEIRNETLTLRTTAQGSSVGGEIDVASGYSDLDGDPLAAIALVTSSEDPNPKHGTVEIDEDEFKITFTSDEGYGGTDSFQYRVYDGTSWSAPATVAVEVLTPPVALPSNVWGFPDTNWPESPDRWKLDFESISFAATDLDASNNAAMYEFYVDNDASPTDGQEIDAEIALVDEAGGRILGDECSGSRVAMRSKARISGLISGLPAHGELNLFFPFAVRDPQGSPESMSMLTVTVITTNEPPWGSPFYHLTIPLRFGEPMIYPLEPAWYEAGCLSFTDPDGDPLRFSLGRPPRKGTVNLLSAGGGGEYSVTMLYEIDRDEALLDHTGEEPFIDTFTVVATDPFGATAETVVEITVDVINSDPVCGDDEVTTPMNTAVEFEVLGNDSDIDGDELTVIAVGVAGNGSASSVAHNMIRYEPLAGFYGDDTFTYTAEDGYGGLDEATVTVHVVDTEPPVFVRGPGDVGPLSNIVGTCSAVGKWTAPVSGFDVTDNIGLASLTCTHTSGDTFPVGITTVTYTATDLSGNTTDHAFTVTVADDERPTIDGMPSDICVEVPLGVTETTVSWIEPTARDNCGIASLVGTHTPGAVFPLGKTSVVYTATDIHGNVVTDSLGVTVAEAWQLACSNKYVATSNPSGTTVSFADPVIGGCGVSVTFNPASGSFFGIGDTDVLCEVTDGVRTETCTFTVTVEFVNHDPVANGDVVDLKDSEIATEIDVLKNDSDADGDDLTIIDVSTPSPCGEVWIDPDGQSAWFIGLYCQPYLGGTATFTYTISDGHGGEDTATVSVDLPDSGTMPEVAEPPKDGR